MKKRGSQGEIPTIRSESSFTICPPAAAYDRVFQARLADRSISLSFDASLDNFSGNLKTLTRNRDEAFDLLRVALTEPRFDEDAVERIRTAVLSRDAAEFAGLMQRGRDYLEDRRSVAERRA